MKKLIVNICKVVFFYWILAALGACGNNVDTSELDAAETNEEEALPKGAGYLQGYVVSAFEMEVDGVQYSDSEDFYTQQLVKIEAEAVEGGYDGYTIKFDAQIGLDDLKRNMKVYIVATQDQGFATDTKVNEKGRFRVSVPESGVQDSYKVRTNKRVTITLTSPDRKDIKKWCYNMSGHETEAQVGSDAIIRTFSTKITRYACSVTTGGGIQIPSNKPEVQKEIEAVETEEKEEEAEVEEVSDAELT